MRASLELLAAFSYYFALLALLH